MADAPIVCSLSTDELGARRAQLLPGLVATATRIDELTDGYRLTFAPTPGVLETIARVIDAERQCCRFLRFQLTSEQDAAPITLDVIGPAGTTEFLQDLFAHGGSGAEGAVRAPGVTKVAPYVPPYTPSSQESA